MISESTSICNQNAMAKQRNKTAEAGVRRIRQTPKIVSASNARSKAMTPIRQSRLDFTLLDSKVELDANSPLRISTDEILLKVLKNSHNQ